MSSPFSSDVPDLEPVRTPPLPEKHRPHLALAQQVSRDALVRYATAEPQAHDFRDARARAYRKI